VIKSRDVVSQTRYLNTILITTKLIRSIFDTKRILNFEKIVILIN